MNNVLVVEKFCKKCQAVKKAEDFYKSNWSRDGLEYSCIACKAEYGRRWGRANREQCNIRARKNRYGITSEEYDALLGKQQNKCAICKADASKFSKRLHVDHCHKTRKIRGLLCFRCNLGLGYFKDEERLNTAVKYLAKISTTEDPSHCSVAKTG